MSRVELICGRAEDFNEWGKVGLVLTNAYDVRFIEHAVSHGKPCIIHDLRYTEWYRESADFVKAGDVFEGHGPRKQTVYLYKLEKQPLDLRMYKATKEGYWPLDFAVDLLALYAKPSDCVIDGFMGRGTTGKACRLLGLDFIGIDKNRERVALAEEYINAG